MDRHDASALLVMTHEFRIANIAVLNTRPNKDFRFLLPTLDQCLQGNGNDRALNCSSRSQHHRVAYCAISERWLSLIAYRKYLPINPDFNVVRWSEAKVLNLHEKCVLLNLFICSTWYVYNMRDTHEPVSEHIGSQLLVGRFAHMVDRVFSGGRGADSSASRVLHLGDSTTHIVRLFSEGYQLKEENTKLDNADKNQITRVFNHFPIIRSLEFCAGLLLFGVGLLFCGGYNIYRERPLRGAALICLGSVFSFGGFMWWDIVWRFAP